MVLIPGEVSVSTAASSETFSRIRNFQHPLGPGLFGYPKDIEIEPLVGRALESYKEVASRVRPLRDQPYYEAAESSIRDIVYRYALTVRQTKGMTVPELRPLLEDSAALARKLKEMIDEHPLASKVLRGRVVRRWQDDRESRKDPEARWILFLSLLEDVATLDIEQILQSADFDPGKPRPKNQRAVGPVGRPNSDHVAVAAGRLSRLWFELTQLSVAVNRRRISASSVEFKSPGTEFVRSILMAIDQNLGHESVIEALRTSQEVAKTGN